MPKPAADVGVAPLSADDRDRLASFSCGDDDLNEFIRVDAFRLQEERVVQSYLAWREDEIVGYVSLMADAIVLQTRERTGLRLRREDHPIIPALKIARVGVHVDHQRGEGIGTLLMGFCFLMALDLSETIGCRLLTLDAYPQAREFYERLGFKMNRAKEYRDKTHPSMRLDVFGKQEPEWVPG